MLTRNLEGATSPTLLGKIHRGPGQRESTYTTYQIYQAKTDNGRTTGEAPKTQLRVLTVLLPLT